MKLGRARGRTNSRGRAATANQKDQRQNNLVTFLAYTRFCRVHPEYYGSWANQLRIMDWIDDRRVEMFAEGRAHWIPSERDFEQAMWDCWDDLVQRNTLS